MESIKLNSIIESEYLTVNHIRKGWDCLNNEEKKIVKERIDKLFNKKKLININTNYEFYIHLFSFLAQVEVLAIQIPLQFMDEFDGKIYKQLRNQLIDEIVHGIIFTKIAYHIAKPYSYPVRIIESAEKFCNYIRNIKDKKIALVCLNLIAEGWIEEIFEHLIKWNICDHFFESILSDEVRHVSEAELYQKIGSVEKKTMEENINKMETYLLDAISYPTISRSLYEIGGKEKYENLVKGLFNKHKEQLKILKINSSKKWKKFESIMINFYTNFFSSDKDSIITEIPLRNDQKMFFKLWKQPTDPTIRSTFTIPLHKLKREDFKYLTSIFIKSCSNYFKESNYRHCKIIVNNRKICKINKINIAVRVLIQLENSYEIGTINIFDLENKSINEIKNELLQGQITLFYWKNYYKNFLNENNLLDEDKLKFNGNFKEDIFKLPPISTFIPFSITNIGKFGYETGFSALTPFNSVDINIGKITSKPYYKKSIKKFIPIKEFKVGLSVDHRVFDPIEFNVNNFKKEFINNCKNFNNKILKIIILLNLIY